MTDATAPLTPTGRRNRTDRPEDAAGSPGLGRWPLARAVEREMRVFSRLWRGTLFSTFLSPVMFLFAMGIGVGGMVNERS